MLVLSRKTNETIQIGDDIELRILEVKGDTVRIGIEAPKSVDILRGELVLSISQSNAEATIVDSTLFSQLTKKNQLTTKKAKHDSYLSDISTVSGSKEFGRPFTPQATTKSGLQGREPNTLKEEK